MKERKIKETEDRKQKNLRGTRKKSRGDRGVGPKRSKLHILFYFSFNQKVQLFGVSDLGHCHVANSSCRETAKQAIKLQRGQKRTMEKGK